MSTIQSALTAAVNVPARNGGSISLNDLVQMGRDGGLPDTFVSGLKDKGLKHNEILTMIVARVAQNQRTAAQTPSVVAQVAAAPVAAVPAAPETADQELARLRRENAALKAASPPQGKISMKMSVAGVSASGQEVKGGSLCIYGFGRFPLVLSQNAVKALFGDPFQDKDPGLYHTVRAFAKAHWTEFRTK